MSILSPSKSSKKQFEFVNRIVNKKELVNLLAKVYEEYGAAKTASLANNLKDLGFKFATQAGITISISDLVVPDAKKQLLADAETELEKSTTRFLKGEITEVERYTKVIDTWSETTDKLTKMVVDNFSRLNPVYMMAFSGARGNISQVRQLVGMRGLMADAQGQIIDMPIKSNFREGLSVTEYIISSYGARKGLVDTALKTADSGYLTRRLVDVAQDVIINEADCGTRKGILVKALAEGETVVVTLESRLISRTSAEDIVDADGEILKMAGEVISPSDAKRIAQAGVKEVIIRSGLTCESQYGICQKCYGWSLTTNKLVDIGEAIGIMAAQSIGEPGTQLTMRTFHTGGAFSGSVNKETIKAKVDGKVAKAISTREFRTRHGDVVQITTRECTLEVTTKDGKKDSYNIPLNASVFVYEEGDAFKAGDVLAEFEPGASRGDARRLTERATKDINSAMSGEVYFEGFDADEKRDRQGNITRTANKAGTVWVLSGDVYNLPAGSKHLVNDKDHIKEGDIIAETLIVSEHGGEVRIPEELKTETLKVGKETVEKITEGKELTIIIASIHPDNAELVQTKKEQLWKVNDEETYIIKSPKGTTVENGSIVAELIDDSMSVPSSGEIRYEELEIDEQRILTKPGKVFFIPEEIHQVNKDISLKMAGMENGKFVKAGTEIVKDVTCRIDGILEIVEENDIIHEVIIRPGELHKVKDVSTLNVDDGIVVDKGTEVAPGIKAKERCLVTINFQMDEPDEELDDEDLDDTSEYEFAEVLLRPVQEFDIAPKEVTINFESSESENITIVPVTQLQFKDGDKIRHADGANLLRTSLVLQMKGYLSRLKGVAELHAAGKKGDEQRLELVVLENLTIRRDATSDTNKLQAATQTQLLVKHGQIIEKKTPVVKTQVLARSPGQVSLGNAHSSKEVRKVLLITPDHEVSIDFQGAVRVKEGDYIKADQVISEKGTLSTHSGFVTATSAKAITLRVGRPYLISGGAQLQVENRSLTQRGDLIATLIFERQKTGDIVQGLPKVEELLEGRKPKESATVAHIAGKAEIIWEDDNNKLYLVSDNGREEISIPVGANIIVDNGDTIESGQPLTDGSINPHDILAYVGVEAVRKYLVDEVQRVYRSQGVDIADKHIEIIVRQMSKKVRVEEGGETTLLPGELVDEKVVLEINKNAQEGGIEELATYFPVLLGITKASLNTESFISAASFQETTRVLTEAAVEGKRDFLRGLKENVIIGRLIPAGTGFTHFKDERDDMFEEQLSASKSVARKPSAILEEIESMFGSPEISAESLGGLLLDDEDLKEEIIDDRTDAMEDDSFLIDDGGASDGGEE
jgi:DNA-directed RNA polymerase subunit beta'